MKTVPWESIPYERAFSILARRVLPAWRERAGRHLGVAGVEIGCKRTGGCLPRDPVVCLKFFVHRKGAFGWTRELPKRVRVPLGMGGAAWVPTDVELVRAIALQGNVVRASRLEADGIGSTGFRVRAKGEPYLVSAAHVLELDPSSQVATWSKDGLDGRGNVQSQYCWVPRKDSTGVTGYFDAGLVSIVQPGALTDAAKNPWGKPALKWDDPVPQTVYICGHHGVVQARFVDRAPTGEFRATIGGKSYPYWRHLCFHAESGQTNGGDSGAPVIAENGTLVAMHFGVAKDDPKMPLGFCAGDLLEHFDSQLLA